MIRYFKGLYSRFITNNCKKIKASQICSRISGGFKILDKFQNKCSESVLQTGHYVVVFSHVNVKVAAKVIRVFYCILNDAKYSASKSRNSSGFIFGVWYSFVSTREFFLSNFFSTDCICNFIHKLINCISAENYILVESLKTSSI